MSYQRLAYDDASSPGEMAVDAQLATAALQSPEPRDSEPVSDAAVPTSDRRRAPFAVTEQTATLADRFVD